MTGRVPPGYRRSSIVFALWGSMKIKSNIAAAVAAGALAAAGAAWPAGAVTYTYEHLAGGDINDLSTLNLQFFVTDSFKITDLNLKFENMVHSYVGDLN